MNALFLSKISFMWVLNLCRYVYNKVKRNWLLSTFHQIFYPKSVMDNNNNITQRNSRVNIQNWMCVVIYYCYTFFSFPKEHFSLRQLVFEYWLTRELAFDLKQLCDCKQRKRLIHFIVLFVILYINLICIYNLK